MNPFNLRRFFNLINLSVYQDAMNCAMANKEGIYRRKNKHQAFDPFTNEMYEALDKVRNKVLSMVMDYKKKHNEPLTVE